MPLFELKKDLAQRLASSLSHPEISADSLLAEFSVPPNPAMGHLALPCFRLGKLLGKPAGKLAQEIASSFAGQDFTAAAAGPYANFRWNPGLLCSKTLGAIAAQRDRYGSDDLGKGKTILLEYCSPNIAKPLFFHHIRSALIGNVLANIYRQLGYRVERINFAGDWGSQFARLLAAFELWGNPKALSLEDVPSSMRHLLDLYVRFHKEIETNPDYLNLANNWLHRLEAHEPKATEMWRLVKSISLASMQSTLNRMKVTFDHIEGESTYIGSIQETLDRVKKEAHAEISEGAWIVRLEGIETPALIQKKDGTTLYLTRDIAAAIDRYSRFHFEKSFYVVGEQQRLHFQQLFGVLKKMGLAWAEQCEHLSFGTVLFGDSRMSTREGKAVYLDEVLDEAQARAEIVCGEKNPSLVDKKAVAEAVGIGAVIFGELSAHRTRDIDFSWEQILALDGETGPYVQYASVRCQSLLEKAALAESPLKDVSVPNDYVFAPEEEMLLLTLAKFRSTLHQAVRDNEPYHLTHFLIDLAKAFNRFYYKLPVLQATESAQKSLRLKLVEATGQTLRNGLTLLGIESPKEM